MPFSIDATVPLMPPIATLSPRSPATHIGEDVFTWVIVLQTIDTCNTVTRDAVARLPSAPSVPMTGDVFTDEDVIAAARPARFTDLAGKLA